MKRTPQAIRVTRVVGFAIAIAVLLPTCPAALAQPNPEAPHHRPPPVNTERRGDRPQPGFLPGRAVPMLERVLSGEQRESLRVAMESEREQTRSLLEKLRDARQALMKITLAEEFDEDAVRAKAVEVGQLEAELTVLRARAISKMQPPLSEEQIERISNPPPREIDGPPDGPGPGPRRNKRPPPGPHDLPIAPKPESP